MTTFRLKHISGLRKEYTLDLNEQELREAIEAGTITRSDKSYYVLYSFEILNPNSTIVENCKEHYDLNTHAPMDIETITVQTLSGKVSKITSPEYDFAFDGDYLLYKNDRIVEINGFSITKQDGGKNFINVSQTYGIFPSVIYETHNFPTFKELTMTFDGYNPFSIRRDPVSLELRGKEVENIWKRVFYQTESENLYLSLPLTKMIITSIDNKPVNPKRIYHKKRLGVRHV